jgi:hypothetical protein
MVYNPGGVALMVETVRKACAGGVAEPGLTAHSGVPAGCTGVTKQGMVSNETGLLELPTAMLRVATEEPPGSTADGESGLDTVRVNCCPEASDTQVAENSKSKRAKTRARTTCLGFTMRG